MKPSPRAGASAPRSRVLVLVLPEVHLQDLAGPVQVLWEAAHLGAAYEIRYVGSRNEVRTAQGLTLAGLGELPSVEPGDLVLIPGTWSRGLGRLDPPRDWLVEARAAGARLAAICSGAFVLASAGLLERRRCTTHWKLTEQLRSAAPGARVLENRLFVEDEGVITSAGVAAGIDLALSIVEHDHGPLVTGRVAREMVVYLRRSGHEEQQSVYLDHRTHLNPGVHRVQDFIVAHPEQKPEATRLARIAGMSARHLSRVFRDATGITPHRFAAKVKLQVASDLLHDPGRTVESIAHSCGFEDARQLRRLWRQCFGLSISASRAARAAKETAS